MQVWRRFLPFGLVLVGFGLVSVMNNSQAESLSSVSVTLSNSRPSFNGRLAAGNTVGTSQITIVTTDGAYPSTDAAQLVEGDSLRIGDTDSLGPYTVTDVTSNAIIHMTPVLLSGDAESGDSIISTQSGILTARLTTKSAINNGRFRILVPALPDDTDSSDGLPDEGFFDFSASTPSVTCPADIDGYDFVAGTATASAVTIGVLQYHSFECAYSGLGAIDSPFDGTTNGSIGIGATNPLINPTSKSGHIKGTADTYKVIIQHIDSNFDVQDTTSVSIGVIEAVRVTASVEPQISFKIGGVLAGAGTPCGNVPTVDTSAYEVELGSLAISSFTHAAQSLAVSTNARNGYAVTAVANDQLGINGGACSGADETAGVICIPDSIGDTGVITHSVSDEWTSTSVKGFGYTLDDEDSTNAEPAFEYSNSGTCTDTTDGGTCTACDGSMACYRHFADAQASQSPVRIFGSEGDTVADNDYIYACYRAVISATQGAGNYENYITYTATATF